MRRWWVTKWANLPWNNSLEMENMTNRGFSGKWCEQSNSDSSLKFEFFIAEWFLSSANDSFTWNLRVKLVFAFEFLYFQGVVEFKVIFVSISLNSPSGSKNNWKFWSCIQMCLPTGSYLSSSVRLYSFFIMSFNPHLIEEAPISLKFK